MLKIGISGLLATQRALATTANNITNASTEGYNRQRVNFSSRPPEFLGGSFLGTGVQVSSIQRVFDGFLAGEIRNGLSGEGRLETFSSLAGRVGNIIGSPNSGLSTGLQSFFSALEGLANDPSSTPVRQVVLTEAQSLARRFNSLDGQMQSISREVDGRVRGLVEEINNLAGSIAQLNNQIASAQGASGGSGTPNDLFDQRDQLIAQLAKKIDVGTIDQGDGTVNVFIGNGQNLVLGARATSLTVGSGLFGPQTQEIRIGNAPVTAQLRGGELGGVLEFRREVLEPVRNELGLMAVAMATEFNRLSGEGLDLNGNLGTDLFGFSGPIVLESGSNSGNAGLSVSIADPDQLTGDDYRLDFTGTEFRLINASSGQALSLSAAQQQTLLDGEELVYAGLSFQVSGAPEAGDRFLVRPTVAAAGSLKTLISDPTRLAAAAPIRAGASLDNIGNATISFGEVADINDPALLQPVTIRFIDGDRFVAVDSNNNPLLGFELADPDDPDSGLIEVGVAYEPGMDISVNGWVVQIDGAPVNGDTFTVQANTGGSGDNRNAVRLAGLFDQPLLGGGTTSLFARSDALVSQVGSTTAAANTALSAQRAVLESSRAAQQAVSGVNLEEEAANLIRFQQAFEANAQVIRVSDTIFQSLLAAVR